jgi:hypothetical protein
MYNIILLLVENVRIPGEVSPHVIPSDLRRHRAQLSLTRLLPDFPIFEHPLRTKTPIRNPLASWHSS